MSNDSYVVALGANVSLLAGDAEAARALMTKLAAKQDKSGAVKGAVTTITRSGGEALDVETTCSPCWLGCVNPPGGRGRKRDEVLEFDV